MYSSFRDNIWGVDLADMELLRKFNKGFRCFYVLLIFLVNILGWFLLKIKKGIGIANAFKKLLKETNHKPNKIWVDEGSEFYNNSF